MKIHKKSEFYSGGRRGRYSFPKESLLVSRIFPEEYSFLDVQAITDFFVSNKRIKEAIIVLDKAEQEQLRIWQEVKARREQWGTMPDAAIEEILSWEVQSKSPYSHSYYNAEVDWDHKPEGSLRLSDHWGWTDDFGITHCCIRGADSEVRKWLLCRYECGQYTIVEEY